MADHVVANEDQFAHIQAKRQTPKAAEQYHAQVFGLVGNAFERIAVNVQQVRKGLEQEVKKL